MLASNDSTGFVQPRGLPLLQTCLGDLDIDIAFTRSVAATLLAPVASARIAMIYADDHGRAVIGFDLRRTDIAANVMILRRFDPVVFARTIDRDGIRVVNPSQIAVDLLTSSGRGPAEAEALLEWMGDNSDVWRS